MRLSLITLTTFAFLPIALGGCQSPSGGRGTEHVALEWEGREHWVDSDALRKIMDELVSSNSWPDRDADVETRSEERLAKALADAAQLAEALAVAGEQIPKTVADVEMSEADRRSFAAQAQTLRDQAMRLQEVAMKGEVESMQKLLDEIDGTCASCHNRFRDYSGTLGPRRADQHRPTPDIFTQLGGPRGMDAAPSTQAGSATSIDS